ncbi:MAG: nucleotidyl transferase AbiEii/AbiGii toxin family protein [Deltaproteobacteria bacterium]
MTINSKINAPMHKKILFQILKDIYSDTSIAPLLGFKGGTAAFMFYGLNRFSVDLDFDLFDESKKKEVFDKIVRIAGNYGTVRDAHVKKFNLLLVLSYDEKATNLKIEINRRAFGSRYEIQTYLGVSMQVMAREDMYAHKLMAMYERIGKTNRDIYDVWFFASNRWPINKEILEQRAGISYGQLLQKCIARLEKMSDRTILSGLGDLLTDERKKWAKTKLRTDTIILLKLALESER